MSSTLRLTFQYLARTKNQAAVEVLVAGLDSPRQATRDGALRALLDRPNRQGHREVFLRLKGLDGCCRKIISQRPERVARIAGEAIHSDDDKTCAAACEAILAFRLYDALPALVSAVGQPGYPQARQAAATILKLTELLYAQLCAPDDQTDRRELDNLRRRATSTLESGLRKFNTHRCREVVEAFLLVAKQQNVVLRQVLQYPQDANCQAILEILSTSPQGGVIRLLLSFLEEPLLLPQLVKNILCSRTDLKFVKNLLRQVGSKTSRNAQEIFGRVERLAWAEPGHEVLRKLDDSGQSDAVRLLLATSIPRNQVLKVLAYLLMEGTTGGRRAAAEALAEFQGPEADALVVTSLNDRDPVVRSHLIRQLRPRDVPGAMSLLIRMVDHPHAEVRDALSESLPEFSVRHFMDNFDKLPESWIAMAGNLVRKIDVEGQPLLAQEMDRLSPVRRRRAVQATSAMGLVRDLEQKIIGLLSDEDHMVRIEAAKALSGCDTMPTWDALRDALLDRSVIVQEAAEQSLKQISRSLAQETSQEQSTDAEGQEVLS